jgi:hypothetical protein
MSEFWINVWPPRRGNKTPLPRMVHATETDAVEAKGTREDVETIRVVPAAALDRLKAALDKALKAHVPHLRGGERGWELAEDVRRAMEQT